MVRDRVRPASTTSQSSPARFPTIARPRGFGVAASRTPWLLALALPPGTPQELPNAASTTPPLCLPRTTDDGQRTMPLSRVRQKPVEWLWPGYVPLGKLTVLDGDPDLGKSTLLLDLAARVSTHGIMPDGKQGIRGNVLLLSAEDGVEDTILPRLLAAGANVDRIEVKNEAGSDGHPPVIPLDLPEIEEDLQRSDARLLLIDTLTAYLAVDTRSDQEVRRACIRSSSSPSVPLCGGLSAAPEQGHRHQGPVPWRRFHRHHRRSSPGLLAAKDPDDGCLVLAQTKHNLGPPMPSLTYELVHTQLDVCRIAWTGTHPKRADELLQTPPTVAARAEEEEQKSKLAIAREWLKDFLLEGPQPVKVCHAEAGKVGITKQTLQRAATVLVGKPKKIEGSWHWSLKET